MIINMTGGGGSDLNFKVVGGTTQPENPKENTIWVNTDTEITSWAFSVEEPETTAEGLVWVKTGFGSSVPFNALKKNEVQVCPFSARQYVDGTWADKTAMIYANGAWSLFHPTSEYLVKAGVIDMAAHTHTATDSRPAKNSVDYSGKPSLSLQGSSGGTVYHYFDNVTVPEWAKTMKIEYYRLAAYSGNPKFSIGSASVTLSPASGAYDVYDGTASIDVEALAGQSLKFGAVVYAYASNYYHYIGNVWFE